MKKNVKKRLLVFFILNSVVAFVYFIILPKIDSTPIRTENFITSTSKPDILISFSPELINNTKFILYWIPMWDSKTFAFGSDGFDLFKRCKFKNCYATHNRSLIPVEDFHAVVFHAAQYKEKKHGKPWRRKPHQRYIFASMEPPTRSYPENLNRFRSFYNWTMTYRYDSDIVRPYGYVIKSNTNYTMPKIEFIKNKTRLVAWFVSNCHTANRREDLHRNLHRYLTIDVYGSCGTLKCPKILHESSDTCYDLIENKYKFYLSFENSHCKDYATEKLYRLLERNIVPVVYGNNDYDKVTPLNSVIIADNYTNAKDLADYLLRLDKNPEDYLKYFEWKKSYYVKRSGDRTACKLCRMLNNPIKKPKVYDDIFLWWLGKNHSHCKIGDGLPKISVPFF